MQTKQFDEKFNQTELGTLKDELVRIEQAAQIEDRIRQMQESLRALQENADVATKGLSLGPSVDKLQRVLRWKAAAECLTADQPQRGDPVPLAGRQLWGIAAGVPLIIRSRNQGFEQVAILRSLVPV